MVSKPRYIDMTGERYGRVEVLEFAGRNENGNALWKCRCDCGVEFITCRSSLRNGTTKSCGCLRAEKSCYNARKVYNKVYDMEKIVSFQQLKPKDVIFRVTPYSREILEFVMVHPHNPQYYVFIKRENALDFIVLHKSAADCGYYFYQNSADVIVKEIEMTEKRLEKLRKRYKERSNED